MSVRGGFSWGAGLFAGWTCASLALLIFGIVSLFLCCGGVGLFVALPEAQQRIEKATQPAKSLPVKEDLKSR